MMTDAKIIEVVQAHANGKQIESRALNNAVWHTCLNPSWSFSSYEYRVQPKPREWWLNLYDEDDVLPEYLVSGHPTREIADRDAAAERTECVRVVEVIDEKVDD